MSGWQNGRQGVTGKFGGRAAEIDANLETRSSRLAPSKDANPARSVIRSTAASSTSSASSKFSLSTSFIDLSISDITFFDNVIDSVLPGANDFASLKRAYNQQRKGLQPDSDTDEEKDAFLWDVMLKLVQVRGKDWAARWDAVRMAIGLEPRVISESEREPSGDDGKRGSSASNNDSSESDTIRNRTERASSPPLIPVSKTSKTTREEIEALRKKMAMLSAEAGSLVGSINKHSEMEAGKAPHNVSILIPREKNRVRVLNNPTPERRLRFEEQINEQVKRRSNKATIVESASDEDRPNNSGRVLMQSRLIKQNSIASTAQRQFEEVVARSRSERDFQKKMLDEQMEAEKESRLTPLLKRMEYSVSKNLFRKCFDWWNLSFEQRRRRELQVVQLRRSLALQKVISAWRIKLRRCREKVRGAEKVDLIRCKLRAWRTWRRAVIIAKQMQREEKKSLLKGAYLLTRKKADQRILQEGFLQWKIAMMEHRTVHFRTQHLVRGAFSLWKLHLWRGKTLKEKELSIRSRQEEIFLFVSWQKWREKIGSKRMVSLAQSISTRAILQHAFIKWSSERQERALLRRKESLADRWRARRTKKDALSQWAGTMKRMNIMKEDATVFHTAHLQSVQAITFQLWILKERESLFVRVKVSDLKEKIFHRWTRTHAELSIRLDTLIVQFQLECRRRTLKRVLLAWQKTTRQVMASQELATKRDDLKRKRGAVRVWRAAQLQKLAQRRMAEERDADTVQKRTWSGWKMKYVEAKGRNLQQFHHQAILKSTLAFWSARAAERRREMLAVGLIRNKMETRIRKECIQRWTRAIIERKSVLIEVVEKRDADILQRSWSKWIDACLRHEDMLSLGKSFLDINKENLMKKTFARWIVLATAERNRRKKMEDYLQQRARNKVECCFDEWYDRYIDATLRSKEYEALLIRQQSAMLSTFIRWKSKVNSIPAIRLDHARVKTFALHHWKKKLPKARRKNEAVKYDCEAMLGKGFRHWLSLTKAKRSIRAAARFGGPSAVRLSAAAHFRQRSNGNPYGPTNSSSPTLVTRMKSIERCKSITSKSEIYITNSTGYGKEEEDLSLRESDLAANISKTKDLNPPIRPHTSTGTPAFQRWMQTHRQMKGRQESIADVDTSSEPPSSLLDQRWVRREYKLDRTPSPTNSNVQSEVTLRTNLNPRKIQLDATNSTILMLKAKRAAESSGVHRR